MFIQKLMKATVPKKLTVLFFILFMIVGLSIVDDYGISWDEVDKKVFVGEANYQLLLKQSRVEMGPGHRCFGPAYLLYLEVAEKVFVPEQCVDGKWIRDSRDIYLFRHRQNFLLFFISTVCFYFLVCRLTAKPWLGLTGSVLLALNPRIFSHSFYNPVDIPLMALFTISMLTLMRLLEKQSLDRIFMHAAFCALVTDIRIVGMLSVLITLATWLWAVFKRKHAAVDFFKQAGLLLIFYSLFVLAFWPRLWLNPLKLLSEALVGLNNYAWFGKVLYWGKLYAPHQLPWHYLLVWIGISTSIFLLPLFFLGLWRIFSEKRNANIEKHMIPLMWLLLPIIGFILTKPVVYDNWRHFYFIYPAFTLLIVYGVNYLFETQSKKFRMLGFILCGLAIIEQTVFIMQKHPFENNYFNRLAGITMGARARQFGLDCWGTEYRQGLEYILANDRRSQVHVSVLNNPGIDNLLILTGEQRRHFRIVGDPESTNFPRSEQLQRFISTNSGYSYRDGRLAVRRKMTAQELDLLRDISSNDPLNLPGLAKMYENSQSLFPADYYIGNCRHRVYAPKANAELFHSFKVDDADLLLIYKSKKK